MARTKFDPNRVLGDKIKDMSRQELCELVGKLCALVRTEVGAGGVRGGIFPENISMDEKGNVAIGPAKADNWVGQELQFAAPELYWNGKRSPASDVYSLGLLLYYGVAGGSLPFEGECSDAQLRRMSGDDFQIPETAGRRLGEIIGKATRFKAGDRYQSMEELGTLLDGCVKNLYLNGAPSAETLFNKADDDLNDLERMMVSIIEKADASPLDVPEEPVEPEAVEAVEPEMLEALESVEAPAAEPESVEAPAAEPEKPAEEENVKLYSGHAEEHKENAEPKKQPVVRLREEKNPELAPVVPAQPVIPAVQYTKSLDREKKIAEEVKRRRRRSVAVILVLCAALVVISIVFNALLHDLNDVPTPDNDMTSHTTSPGYVMDYADPADVPDESPTVSDGGLVENTVPDGGAVDAAPSSEPVAGGGESSYDIFVEDVSWTEAQARCAAKGGHLAVVTDQAELDKIIALADEKGVQMLWLGCRRVNGELVWETGESVDFYPWAAGEPSLEDKGDNVAEDYLLLWNHNGWSYNDSRNDPVADYPQWYGGNIAYVCEYDG